jgi:hypothetical protein
MSVPSNEVQSQQTEDNPDSGPGEEFSFCLGNGHGSKSEGHKEEPKSETDVNYRDESDHKSGDCAEPSDGLTGGHGLSPDFERPYHDEKYLPMNEQYLSSRIVKYG